MGDPIVHWEIIGTDGAALQSFYRDLFAWDIDTDYPQGYGMVKGGPEGVTGGVGTSQHGRNFVTVYAEVDDLQAYLDKAERLGGKTVVPPTEVPEVATYAQFEDPAGNLIGLVQRRSA